MSNAHLYFLYEFLLVQKHHFHVVSADSLAEAAHGEDVMTSHYRHEVPAPTAGGAMSRSTVFWLLPKADIPKNEIKTVFK
jgi:hypothetical protein